MTEKHHAASPVSRPDLGVLEHGLIKFGIPAALAYLNSWVPHRFTTVYKLEGGIFRATHVFDKEKKVGPDDIQPFKLRGSFCEIALREGAFLTLDSALDARTLGRPDRGVVRSYVGAPLSLADNQIYGTLCHNDFVEQRAIDAQHYEHFKQSAALLAHYL